MANEEKNYTSELKAEIAQKALEQDKENLDRLSEKYKVPVSKILMWATTYEKGGMEGLKKMEKEATPPEGEAPIEDEETVEVDVTDERVADSFTYGVMGDQLNYKRLIYWSVLGIVLVVIFIVALFEMYQYNFRISTERISEESQFYEVNRLREEAEERLSTFGVVDLEKGLYRIPIDSALDDIAVDSKK